MVTAEKMALPQDRVRDFDFSKDLAMRDGFHARLVEIQRTSPDVFYTRANGGHWVVTRQALMNQILHDTDHFSSVSTQVPLLETPQIQIPLHLDPPENLPYRTMLMRYFSRPAVGQREANIRAWAKKLVGAVAQEGHCEFIQSVCMPFPVSIFMELAGFPLEKIGHFRSLAVSYLLSLQDLDEVQRIIGLIQDEVSQIVESKRANPGDDLVSDLLRQTIDGRPLSDNELHSICFLLFIGGLDTVVNAASFVFLHLARSPEWQETLRNDPSEISAYVEECFRMFGVVNTVRVAKKDVALDGMQIRAGEPVMCLLPLAGMDERANSNPEKFDAHRANRVHMLFGGGVHLCLGHHLARLELRILLEEWLQAVPQFKLADGFHPRYQPAQIVSLAGLELEWTPVNRGRA